jgi:hypothetical protein
LWEILEVEMRLKMKARQEVAEVMAGHSGAKRKPAMLVTG